MVKTMALKMRCQEPFILLLSFLGELLRILFTNDTYADFVSHLINSPRLCQQSCQLTTSISTSSSWSSNPPILDKFPQRKIPWLSFRLGARSQITETLYL